MRLFRGLLAALALLVPASAFAQAQSCTIPGSFPLPRASSRLPEAVRTPVTRYTLALSWSPGYCQRPDADPRSMQCSGEAGRFGFILHGLWPESDGGRYPQYCARGGQLPRQVIRDNLCVTPSPELMQHEWERHGSCYSRDPARYFATGARLYRQVRFPAMRVLAADRALTVGQFRAAFARANPGMDASMLAMLVNRGGWLQEVHVCMNRALRWHACPAGMRDAGDNGRLRIDLP